MEESAQQYTLPLHSQVKSPITHWAGVWVVSREGMDVLLEEKISCL